MALSRDAVIVTCAMLAWAVAASAVNGGTASTLSPPRLARLAAGALQPSGWLKAEAELQGNGMTGGLGFWPGGGISANKWLAQFPYDGKQNTNGEEQGGEYFLNGMIPLTCQIDLPALRQLREASVRKILRTTAADGYFGGDLPNGTIPKDPKTYWGTMILVLALESYAECTGPFAPTATMQASVENALVAHHKAMYARVAANNPAFVDDVWGSARYSEVLLGVEWLIDRGHNDKELWDLMSVVRNQSETSLGWESWFAHGDPTTDKTTDEMRCWPNKSSVTEAEWQRHHGVSIMEAIKTGPAWFRVSGNTTDANNSAAAIAWIDKYARSADGTFTAPDCIAQIAHLPTSGVETCSVVEEMFSLRTAYETTGSIALFDRLEFVAFNSMPATTDAKWTGNAHYHSVNQIHASGTTGFGMNGCCTGNVHQGWPKFIMSGVQTVAGNASGIVVSGYSPVTATLHDGTTVAVGGQYPFADNATVTVTCTEGGPQWSLALRIPCWVNSAQVVVSSSSSQGSVKNSMPATPCSLFQVPTSILEATRPGERLELTVFFENIVQVVKNKWFSPAKKWKNPKGAVEIRRGPLLFSFPIPSIANVTQLNGTQIQKTSYLIDGTKPWQIALKDPTVSLKFGGFSPVAQSTPFDPEQPPIFLTAQAREVTTYVKGNVPDSPVPLSKANSSLFNVTLVPLAFTQPLRVTVLPVLED